MDGGGESEAPVVNLVAGISFSVATSDAADGGSSMGAFNSNSRLRASTSTVAESLDDAGFSAAFGSALSTPSNAVPSSGQLAKESLLKVFLHFGQLFTIHLRLLCIASVYHFQSQNSDLMPKKSGTNDRPCMGSFI